MLGKGLTSFFCMWMSSFICTVCWKGCHFPTLNDLGSLVKIIWPYVWVFISGLSILFHWCIYLSYPTSHWFCYCSIIVRFETVKHDSSNFVLLFVFFFFVNCFLIFSYSNLFYLYFYINFLHQLASLYPQKLSFIW